jgi:tRNA 2-thiouridine synthesizing protein A
VIGADGHHDRGEEMTEFNHELDACGLNCPLPVLRTKKTLDKMASGEVLQIIATDPELLETRQESDKYYFLMKKG